MKMGTEKKPAVTKMFRGEEYLLLILPKFFINSLESKYIGIVTRKTKRNNKDGFLAFTYPPKS